MGRESSPRPKEKRRLSSVQLNYHDLSKFYQELAVGREERQHDHDKAAHTHEEFAEAEHNAEDIIDSMTRILAPARRQKFFRQRMRASLRLSVDLGYKFITLRMATINEEIGVRGTRHHLMFRSLIDDFCRNGYRDIVEAWQGRHEQGLPPLPRTAIQRIQAQNPIRLVKIWSACNAFEQFCKPYLGRRNHYSRRKQWYEKLLAEQSRVRGMLRCDFYRHSRPGTCVKCGADFVHNVAYLSTDVLSNPMLEADHNAEITSFPERVLLEYAVELIWPLIEHAGTEAEESLAFLIQVVIPVSRKLAFQACSQGFSVFVDVVVFVCMRFCHLLLT